MKKRILAGAGLLVLVLLLPLSLHAQIPQQLLQADIPFAFIAAGIHLPAGHYYVSHPTDPTLVMIRKADNRARAVVFVSVSESNSEAVGAKLVFNKYGDRYFLSQIWTERDGQLHEARKCRFERTLLAQSQKPAEVVVLARK